MSNEQGDSLSDLIDEAFPSSPNAICTCVPCTTPAFGAPYLTHCAACCYNTGVSDYDYDCPAFDHAEMAVQQHGPRKEA